MVMSDLQGRSILITGAGGFLGNVVMEHSKQMGARVVGTVRSPKGEGNQDLVTLDLEKAETLKILDETGPFEAVVHCAAELPGKRPDMDLLIANQRMTDNILQWALKAQLQHFVFASSCNIYGYSTMPCTEVTLPNPPMCYSISKLASEHLANMAGAAGSMPVCVLRISAPYGPHLRNETVIKRFIYQAAQQEKITLLGTGERSQDFVYEDDIAQAFVLALAHTATGTFNIAGDRSVNMRELARIVLEIFGLDHQRAIRVSGIDPQEKFRGCYPITAAAQAFGYRPQVLLEEGLRRTAKAWGFL